MKLSVSNLIELNTCGKDITLFQSLFVDEIDLNMDVLMALYKSDFDVQGWAQKVFGLSFKRANAMALAMYNATKERDAKTFKQKKEMLKKVKFTSWEDYKKLIEPEWEIYKKTQILAWTEYKKAQARVILSLIG